MRRLPCESGIVWRRELCITKYLTEQDGAANLAAARRKTPRGSTACRPAWVAKETP